MRVSQRILCLIVILTALVGTAISPVFSITGYWTEESITGCCYFLSPVSGQWEKVLDGSTFTVPAGEPLQFRFGDSSTLGEELSDIDSFYDPYYLADILDCKLWFDAAYPDAPYNMMTALPSQMGANNWLWDDQFITKEDGLTAGTHVVRWEIADRAYYGAHQSGADDDDIQASATFIADATPPDLGVVDDGVFTGSKTQLHARYFASDPECGISSCYYAVGTTPQPGQNVVWTQVALCADPANGCDIACNGNFLEGVTYYFYVKVYNNLQVSSIQCSDGITVDTIPPDIQISAPPASKLLYGGSTTFTITYTGCSSLPANWSSYLEVQTASGSAAGQVTSVTGTGLSRTVTVANLSGDGSLKLVIRAGSAVDPAGNSALVKESGEFSVDADPPQIQISAPPTSPLLVGGSTTFTITYTGCSSLPANWSSYLEVQTVSGNAAGQVTSVTGTGLSRNVKVANLSGEGSIKLAVKADSAVDPNGNRALSKESGEFGVDAVRPTVTISTPTVINGKLTCTITANGQSSYDWSDGICSKIRWVNKSSGSLNYPSSGSFATSNPTTFESSYSAFTGESTVALRVDAGAVVDAAGNQSLQVESVPVAIDQKSPTGSIEIVFGSFRKDGLATLDLDAHDGLTPQSQLLMRIRNESTPQSYWDNNPDAGWFDFRLTQPWYFSSGNGYKTVYVQYRDQTPLADGTISHNTSPAYQATMYVDTTSPVISIDEPASVVDVVLNFPDNQGDNFFWAKTYSGMYYSNLPDAGSNIFSSGNDTVMRDYDHIDLENTYDSSNFTSVALSYETAFAGTYRFTGQFNLDDPNGQAYVYFGPGFPSNNVWSTDTLSTDLNSVYGRCSATTTSGVGLSICIGSHSMSNYSNNKVRVTGVISQEPVPVTKNGPVKFKVNYVGAERIVLDPSYVDLITEGDVSASDISVSGIGTSSRYITVSNIQGDGALGISIRTDSAFDAVGNPAPAYGPSPLVPVDNTPPTDAYVTLSNSEYTSQRTINWYYGATDPGSGVYKCRSREGSASWGPWTRMNQVSQYFTLSQGNGTKYVYVQFMDALGNICSECSDSITLLQ